MLHRILLLCPHLLWHFLPLSQTWLWKFHVIVPFIFLYFLPQLVHCSKLSPHHLYLSPPMASSISLLLFSLVFICLLQLVLNKCPVLGYHHHLLLYFAKFLFSLLVLKCQLLFLPQANTQVHLLFLANHLSEDLNHLDI